MRRDVRPDGKGIARFARQTGTREVVDLSEASLVQLQSAVPNQAGFRQLRI
jgi:hypothetical protein